MEAAWKSIMGLHAYAYRQKDDRPTTKRQATDKSLRIDNDRLQALQDKKEYKTENFEAIRLRTRTLNEATGTWDTYV